jgi:hypothetical protein
MNNILINKNEDDDFAVYFSKFLKQLGLESERGSAIVGAALIDDALAVMLKLQLTESAQKEDELFDGPYAPLASLSTKIDLACRTGLISPKVRTSLHIIRKLRNDFAHVALQLNFESPSVHNRIRELFNLNKETLDLLWRIIKDNYEDVIMDNESEHGMDNLVEKLGWKSTYELLASVIAATFLVNKKRIPRIVSIHRD